METFIRNKPSQQGIGFLKLFNKLKDKFGLLKASFSTLTENNRRLENIYTNNTITMDIIKKYTGAKYFLLSFIIIDAALAIPFAVFILTNIFMIAKGSPVLRPIALISSPLFSTLLIAAAHGIIKKTLSYNLERTNRKKLSFTLIGGFALLLLIPMGTLFVWVSANHSQLWRIIFDIAAPIVIAMGVCAAVYVSAKFKIKHQNLEETIKEYKEAKDLEDHNEDIIGSATNLKKEIEIIASRFRPYVMDDSVSQINKRFATLPLDERYILIEKIYRWRDDQFFASGEKDVIIQNYFGPEIEENEFVKFWKTL